MFFPLIVVRPVYRPSPVTNILSNNSFSVGNVDVRHSANATVIVGSQVNNTVSR